MFEVKLKPHSSLYPYMQDYIHEREIKGICTGEAKTILSNFECYSASVGYSCEHISREHYHNWIIIGLTVLRVMKHTNPCTYVV